MERISVGCMYASDIAKKGAALSSVYKLIIASNRDEPTDLTGDDLWTCYFALMSSQVSDQRELIRYIQNEDFMTHIERVQF